MSKIGVHVKPGSRNGYGPLCEAKPAVVIGVDEGGAVGEAIDKSGGHTWGIFRDTTVYLDAPGGIDQATPQAARQMADTLFPILRAKWLQNPANFYTVLNEPVGNDTTVLPSYLAYELRMMELAEAFGYKLCVLNLAGGTPGDLQLWKDKYVPHIARAFQAGHIYGRHAYGGQNITTPDGNTNRPFIEAEHLRSVGLGGGGIVITECGFNGGFGYVGDEHFLSQVQGYDNLLMQHSNIIGACMWTLGVHDNCACNWETATPGVAQWMITKPTPKWQPGTVTPPLDEQLWNTSMAQPNIFNPALGLWKAIVADGLYPAHFEVGAAEGNVIQAGVDPKNVKPRKLFVWKAGQAIRSFTDPNVSTPQLFQKWPTDFLDINQAFGANPGVYGQFGLPGHEGVDIKAPLNTPIYTVRAGKVIIAENNPNSGNYGRNVRVDHGDGQVTIYSHMESLSVTVNQQVTAGELLGMAGTTGNSTGAHLHFGLKITGQTYIDKKGQPWPNNFHNPWNYMQHLYKPTGRVLLEGWVYEPYLVTGSDGQAVNFGTNLNVRTGPGATHSKIGSIPANSMIEIIGNVQSSYVLVRAWAIAEVNQVDMAQYFFPSSGNFGDIVILKNNWGQGDERQQLQRVGDLSYVTKNNQWERRRITSTGIYLEMDTSPGDDEYYTVEGQWLPRLWKIGNSFTRIEKVRFFGKGNCQQKAMYNSTNSIRFDVLHAQWTSPTNITFNNVIELAWILGNVVEERYWYAQGVGLVQWKNKSGLHSWANERIAVGTQANNVREQGCFG